MPSNCVLTAFPHCHPQPRASSARARGSVVRLQCQPGCGCGSPDTGQSHIQLLMCHLLKRLMDCSHPLRCHSGSELVLFITTKHSFWLLQLLSSCGAELQCKRGWSKCLALAGVPARAVEGNQTKSCAVSICFLHLVSAGRKCVQVLHEQSLFIALLLVSLVL